MRDLFKIYALKKGTVDFKFMKNGNVRTTIRCGGLVLAGWGVEGGPDVSLLEF